MSNNPSRPSSPTPYTIAEDETLQLALTLMALPSSSSNRPSSPPPHAAQPDTLSPSSIGSWVDLPSPAPLSPHTRTSTAPNQRRHRVRYGLANLPNPPSPFGTQLEPSTRSTPYTHTPSRSQQRFNPRPTPRELAVENDEVPRPNPDDVYDTFLSAYESVKNIAVGWLTDNDKKDLTLEVTKIGLWALIMCRPRWMSNSMNWSYNMIRDPWRVYHHTFITFVVSSVLSS